MKGKVLGWKDTTQQIAVEWPNGQAAIYEIPDKDVYNRMKLESELELVERTHEGNHGMYPEVIQ